MWSQFSSLKQASKSSSCPQKRQMEWLLLSDLTTGRQSVRHFLRPKSSEPGLTLALVWILVWEETNQMAILQKMSLWLRYVNHAGSLCFYSSRQEVCIHGLAVKVLLLVSIYIYASGKKSFRSFHGELRLHRHQSQDRIRHLARATTL